MSIRLLGSEAACGVNVGAASTFLDATDVRLVNSGTTVRLVTVANAADTTLTTLSLAGAESVILRKDPTDQIFAANAEILGVGCVTEG
jgi:5-enolpyruvylshikimate-3-phosphate synthase